MNYQERIAALKQAARYNPEMTDRELSIAIDAEFGKEETEDDETAI